jgi:hypothetical protein
VVGDERVGEQVVRPVRLPRVGAADREERAGKGLVGPQRAVAPQAAVAVVGPPIPVSIWFASREATA